MNDSYDEQLPRPEELAPLTGPPPPLVELSAPPQQSRESNLWKYALVCAGFAVIYLLMILLGRATREFAFAGLEAIPFAILAIIAYAARPDNFTRGLALAYWVMLTGALSVFSWIFTVVALTIPNSAGERAGGLEMGIRIGGMSIGLIIAGLLALACFHPAVRRWAAGFLDIDALSFVHATALATAVAVTLIFLVPLLAVNEPPIISLIRGETLSPVNLPDPDENLRTTLYGLIWSVPASFLAVGFPGRRTIREARERLGLFLPSWRQMIGVIGSIGMLLLSMHYLEIAITWFWQVQGWPVTDADAIAVLFRFGAGPIAAVLVGICAGLGEELVFRGVLQPRLGIVLPALMFTSVHAFQYHFDALIQVLLLGLAFGVIRKWTNTTTCVLIHAGYDCVLLFWMYLAGGGA